MNLSFKKAAVSIAKVLLFLFLFVTIYSYTRDVLRGSSTATALRVIAEQPDNTYDVILAGPSHMQYAIQPAQLFGEHGIVACNTASAAQSIPTTYYVVKEMIDRHDPELVVLDLFNLFYPEVYFNQTRFHQAIDNFTFSRIKAEAINDLVDEGKAEFYLNYLLYHGRWKSLTESDYRSSSDFNASYQIRGELTVFSEPFIPIDPSETAEIPEIPLDYLKRIVDLCKETDTQLLLTVVPYRADVDNNDTSAVFQQKMYNAAALLAEEWDVDFLNSLHHLDEMQFDFATDMREYSHVNASGSEKISKYYGNYFVEHYDLPNQSENKKYADWHDDYQAYLTRLEILKASPVLY